MNGVHSTPTGTQRLLFADSKNRDYPSGNSYRDAPRPVADMSAPLHLTTPIKDIDLVSARVPLLNSHPKLE
jgi:hypothetical protein